MFTMSGVRWTVLSLLLLWKRTGAHKGEVLCYVEPAGARHPVQGLLERFKAGPGCAARGSGDLETHVIAVGTANNPGNTVTVLLKPLNRSPSPPRALHLLLSSKFPLTWWLEADGLPPNRPVLVQVSPNSSVLSRGLHLNVQAVTSLPFHPRALQRWALKHHGRLTSVTHAERADRVYVRLGEDPSLPAVCQLQSMFLSHNYLTSELQSQEVQGCGGAAAGGTGREVHVIKLHSACSGLCSSLRVEVMVSLVPLRADSKSWTVVLILSSSVPVNWAVAARGVRGHVSVHSSSSVLLPYPPEPDLTLSSTLNSDLSTIPDLLAWAREHGYTERLTSYTEADLANRFVIRLAGGVTDADAVTTPVVMRPPWAKERRLRRWLDVGGGAGGGRDSFSVQCEDGRLSVTVDRRVLQRLPVPVTAVTLRDSTCLAKSNGSHFLLVFPVISCGTVALLLGQPRGMQYKNIVLLWRDEPQATLALNETSPLAIQVTCVAEVPTLPVSADVDDADVNTPTGGPVPWGPEVPWPDPGMGHLLGPRHGSAPVLLKLFVDERYEHRRIGPRVVTADQRVYVEISANGPFIDAVEVESCVVSPVSDPKKSNFWTVISDGCSTDPSLTLSAKTKDEEEEGGDDEQKEEKGEMDGLEKRRDGNVQRQYKVDRRGREAQERMGRSSAEQDIQSLKFSFILRAVYNDSLQFLHCSVRLCVSDLEKGEPAKERVKNHCQGRLRIPPVVSRSARHQCEIRYLYRPLVVTQPISSPAPSARARNKTLSGSPLASPDSHHTMPTGPEIGVIFAAFVMGVCMMGGMWCIHYYTGTRLASLGSESNLTERTHEGCNIWNPVSTSDQSASSV